MKSFGKVLVGALAAISLAFASCSSSSSSDGLFKVVTGLEVSPETVDMTIGQTQALTVTASYSDSTKEVVAADSIVSSNSDVCLVEGTTLKAVKAGSAVITVTYKKVWTKSVNVSVKSADRTVTGISFGGALEEKKSSNPYKLTLNGSVKVQEIILSYSDGTEDIIDDADDIIDMIDAEEIELTPSDTDFLKVSGNKIIGKALLSKDSAEYVTIKYNGPDNKYASKKIRAKAFFYVVDGTGPVVTLESIKAVPASLSMDLGATQTVTLKAVYSNSTEETITATEVSTIPLGVVSAEKSGAVTAIGLGTTSVKFTYSDSKVCYVDVPVTVTKTLASISAASTNVDTISYNSDAYFKVTANYNVPAAYEASEGHEEVIPDSITSSSSYVTITGNKIANNNTSSSDQTVTITATYKGKTCTFTVIAKAEPVADELGSIQPDENNVTTIAYGSNATFKVIPVMTKSGKQAAVTPTSLTANNSAASVSGAVVTNNNASQSDVTVTLTATYSGKTCTMTVKLAARANVLESIEAASTNKTSLEYNASTQLKVVPVDTFGTKGTAVSPTLSSSSPYVKITEGNTVQNVNASGSTQAVSITATYSGKTCVLSLSLESKKDELDSISADPANATEIDYGKTQSFLVIPHYSITGTKTAVAPTLAISSPYATATGNSITNNNSTSTTQTISVRATYNGVSITFDLALKPQSGSNTGNGGFTIQF